MQGRNTLLFAGLNILIQHLKEKKENLVSIICRSNQYWKEKNKKRRGYPKKIHILKNVLSKVL